MAKNRANRDGAKGNTETLAKKDVPKQSNQVIRWCLTFNNYSEKERSVLIETLETECKRFIVGREKGKENGTEHLQGYMELKSKRRLTELKNIFSDKIHWEPARAKEDANRVYCSKEGRDIVSKGFPRKPYILPNELLYVWQKGVVDIVKSEPDERSIYWFWEKKGCAGKTSLAKKLSVENGAIPVEGKKNDILYCAAEFESDCYIFDFERSMEDFISYGAIEKIKNGYFMCSKYESKPIIRANPHVICFANFPPDVSKLSKDRWKITEISKLEKPIPEPNSSNESEPEEEDEERDEEYDPWSDM